MPVVTIGRQFRAGGTAVGEMLAKELHADLLESRIIDEVAHRLQLPKEGVDTGLGGDLIIFSRLIRDLRVDGSAGQQLQK